MPHFVVDCSENVLSIHDETVINENVHAAANSSGLFDESNIQVRTNSFSHNIVGNKRKDFLHVFASILEGRTPEQKAQLSRAVVGKLVEMFPQVSVIGIDIKDLDKEGSFNRNML